MHLRRLLSAVALSALLAHTGCGGKGSGDGQPGAAGTPTGKQALEDLVRSLQDFEAKNQKPPTRLAAMEPIEPLFPAAYIGLSKGDIVYAWGVPLSPGSSNVLAHEKKTPTEGGWVLLQDGTVKEMTAAEFGSAPKAK